MNKTATDKCSIHSFLSFILLSTIQIRTIKALIVHNEAGSTLDYLLPASDLPSRYIFVILKPLLITFLISGTYGFNSEHIISCVICKSVVESIITDPARNTVASSMYQRCGGIIFDKYPENCNVVNEIHF